VLLVLVTPACVRGVDSGSTLYCATGGGVHQVRVPICRLLRIMTGYFWRAGTAVRVLAGHHISRHNRSCYDG